MSNPSEKPVYARPGVVTDINAELDIKAKLNSEFDKVIKELTSTSGVKVFSHEDLNALAELLFETTEQRKRLESQEKNLKAELKRYFTEGAQTLDCGSLIALLEKRSRANLDREALTRDLGSDFLSRYESKTDYEILTVKKKVV